MVNQENNRTEAESSPPLLHLMPEFRNFPFSCTSLKEKIKIALMSSSVTTNSKYFSQKEMSLLSFQWLLYITAI